ATSASFRRGCSAWAIPGDVGYLGAMRMPGPATEQGEVGAYGQDVGDQPDRPRPGPKARWWLVGAVIAALVLTAVLSYRWGSGTRPEVLPAPTPSASPTPPTTAQI